MLVAIIAADERERYSVTWTASCRVATTMAYKVDEKLSVSAGRLQKVQSVSGMFSRLRKLVRISTPPLADYDVVRPHETT